MAYRAKIMKFAIIELHSFEDIRNAGKDSRSYYFPRYEEQHPHKCRFSTIGHGGCHDIGISADTCDFIVCEEGEDNSTIQRFGNAGVFCSCPEVIKRIEELSESVGLQDPIL